MEGCWMSGPIRMYFSVQESSRNFVEVYNFIIFWFASSCESGLS